MSPLFNILELGEAQLRQRASPVTSIDEPLFQQTLDDLEEFVINQGGMGIAAPQVGISQRFFILSSHPNDRYPYAPDIKPFAVINPEIIGHDQRTEIGWEGCLSVPGIRGQVLRYSTVDVRFQQRDGAVVEIQFDGFLARVFQHELDHLDGILFIDRVPGMHALMSEKAWRKHIQTSAS